MAHRRLVNNHPSHIIEPHQRIRSESRAARHAPVAPARSPRSRGAAAPRRGAPPSPGREFPGKERGLTDPGVRDEHHDPREQEAGFYRSLLSSYVDNTHILSHIIRYPRVVVN